MATPKKQAAKKTAAPRKQLNLPPPDGKNLGAKPEEGEVMVTVTVPKNFNLTVAHGKTFHYKAGVQEMPLVHAEHRYSVANGVTIYDPKAAAKKKQEEAEAAVLAAKREQAVLAFNADAALQEQYAGDFEAYFADQQQ